MLDAVRSSKDGEFVTVQNKDSDVRVAKQNNYFLVHVADKRHPSKKSNVEVKIPMKVVDALFSAGKDELDLVAGLRALSAQGAVSYTHLDVYKRQVYAPARTTVPTTPRARFASNISVPFQST